MHIHITYNKSGAQSLTRVDANRRAAHSAFGLRQSYSDRLAMRTDVYAVSTFPRFDNISKSVASSHKTRAMRGIFFESNI